MKILINDELTETDCANLAALLEHLNYSENTVATAVDGAFVPRQQRQALSLIEGMKVEIVAPMQGG